MNKWFELLLGLILLNIVVVVLVFSNQWVSFWNFRHASWEFFKGGLMWLVIMMGILFIALGISDLKE